MKKYDMNKYEMSEYETKTIKLKKVELKIKLMEIRTRLATSIEKKRRYLDNLSALELEVAMVRVGLKEKSESTQRKRQVINRK